MSTYPHAERVRRALASLQGFNSPSAEADNGCGRRRVRKTPVTFDDEYVRDLAGREYVPKSWDGLERRGVVWRDAIWRDDRYTPRLNPDLKDVKVHTYDDDIEEVGRVERREGAVEHAAIPADAGVAGRHLRRVARGPQRQLCGEGRSDLGEEV